MSDTSQVVSGVEEHKEWPGMAEKELKKLVDPHKCEIDWHSGCLFIKTHTPSGEVETHFSVKIRASDNMCEIFSHGSTAQTGYLVPSWLDFQPGVKDTPSSSFFWNISIVRYVTTTKCEDLKIRLVPAFVNYTVHTDQVFFLMTLDVDQLKLMRFDQFLALVKFFSAKMSAPNTTTEHFMVLPIPSPNPAFFMC